MTHFDHIVRQDCPLPRGTHVVAYCRDSGGDEQDRSVDQQREAIQGYCKKHGLILENGIYADTTRSGSNAEQRDDLNRMLTDLRSRFKAIRDRYKREAAAREKPFGVVFWKSNRLGRDATETTFVKTDLRMRGLTIVTLVTNSETGNAGVDAVMEALQNWQDEQALDEISSNAKRGLAQLVTLRDTDPTFRLHNPKWPTHDGRYLGIRPGVAPIGFKGEMITVGMNRRGEPRRVQRIVPDPEVMPRVKLAWEMRVRGATMNQIHDATALHHKPTGYSNMFQNRIYLGVLEYGDLVIEDFVEPVITQEMFDREQSRRAERNRARTSQGGESHPRRVSSRHLLSGLVKCGAITDIEHPMHAESSRGGQWDYYTCTHRRNTRNRGCSLPYASARGLEKLVIEYVINDVLTLEVMRPLAKALSTELSAVSEEAKHKLKAARARRSALEKAVDHLLNMIETNGADGFIVERLQKRRSELSETIHEIETFEEVIAQKRVMYLPTDAQLLDWIESMKAALQSNEIELIRMALKVIVRKVVVTGKQTAVIHSMPLHFNTNPRVQALTPSGHALYTRFNIISLPLQWTRQPATYFYSDEDIAKRREAKLMRAEGATYQQIARLYGVTVEAARQWVIQPLPKKTA